MNFYIRSRWICRSMLTLCFCGLVFLLLFPGFSAAGPVSVAQSGQAYTLRVDVELVTVEVIVLDKKGNPVQNLKRGLPAIRRWETAGDFKL
jgi:hypothetical protein